VERARGGGTLDVVADEFGSPTASADLARGIIHLATLDATGIIHLTGSGSCSRYEMAREVLDSAGIPVRLVPVSRSSYVARAIRPANSVLCLDKARRLGVQMPPWRDSLTTYVRRYLRQAG
jgi:dTDP-4-dehydrorhamnose reductase